MDVRESMAQRRLWDLCLDPVHREVLDLHEVPAGFGLRHLRLAEVCALYGLTLEVIVDALREADEALLSNLNEGAG